MLFIWGRVCPIMSDLAAGPPSGRIQKALYVMASRGASASIKPLVGWRPSPDVLFGCSCPSFMTKRRFETGATAAPWQTLLSFACL